jgi:hypothetical protein
MSLSNRLMQRPGKQYPHVVMASPALANLAHEQRSSR